MKLGIFRKLFFDVIRRIRHIHNAQSQENKFPDCFQPRVLVFVSFPLLDYWLLKGSQERYLVSCCALQNPYIQYVSCEYLLK